MKLNLLLGELKIFANISVFKDSQVNIQNRDNIYRAGFKVGLFNGGNLSKRKRKIYKYIYKSPNLFKFIFVLLSTSVERVGVSRMQDFLKANP